MRRVIGFTRNSPVAARTFSRSRSASASSTWSHDRKPRRKFCSALARPSDSPGAPNGLRGARKPQSASIVHSRHNARALHHAASPPPSLPARKDGSLGQSADSPYDEAVKGLWQTRSPDERIQEGLAREADSLREDDLESWDGLLGAMRRAHGADGCWSVFQLMLEKHNLDLLVFSEAEFLRDRFLEAALDSEAKIAVLVGAAQHLSVREGFQWPDLYVRIVHSCLERGQFEMAVRWHLQLASNFPPDPAVFGALLSSFVVDPRPKMQSCLTTICFLNSNQKFYDYIIPALFASGQSKLARTWRKKFILFKDFPETHKARPFLRFLASYYPSMSFAEEELAVAGLEHTPDAALRYIEESRSEHDRKGVYSDSIVAKWFASSWTSVEFAINLVHRLGLRTIGPRSLQSLALREADAKEVAQRISQLEKLGVHISNQTYCKALVFFAKNGEDTLLSDLLTCDIHPDEFDDAETRQMLMASSTRDGDWKTERLFQGVEWATETGSSSLRLNSMLRSELSKKPFSRTNMVLDRMEALKVNMAQYSATRLLQRVFDGVGEHPNSQSRLRRMRNKTTDPSLDRAVDVIRRVACHDVAIPLQYWRVLLHNLGRLKRLDELDQLSLEIVQLYSAPFGGLMPIHRQDLPRTVLVGQRPVTQQASADDDDLLSQIKAMELNFHDSRKEEDVASGAVFDRPQQETTAGSGTQSCEPSSQSRPLRDKSRIPSKSKESQLAYEAEEKEYIPADLPFSHREHPVQKIFDPSLQRSIVRWGFDQTLAAKPNPGSAYALTDRQQPSIAAFDVARGVRLLALLRDQGVLVDPQIVRSAVISRIAVGQIPGRKRDRARDSQEVSAENLKGLVEEAWAGESGQQQQLLPELPAMLDELEAQKPRLWSRYPKLFARSYDHQRGRQG